MKNNVKHSFTMNTATIATRVDEKLSKRASQAAKKVGLSMSDLMRAGLSKVTAEIESKGSLNMPVRRHQPEQRRTEEVGD